MTLETLEIQPLTPNATVTRAHDADAGLDLHCIEDFHIDGLGRITVGTGIAIDLPEGYMARVCPRSGLARNYGIDILGGIIDAGYRGEIKVILHNTSTSRVNFRCGDRIAQLVITPVETPESARSSTLPTRRNVEETDSARPDDERREPVMKRNIYNIHGQRLRDTQASMLVRIVETHRMPSSAFYAKPLATLGSLIDRNLIIPLADGTYKPTKQGIETADAIRRLDRGEPIRRTNIAERGINRNFNKYWDDYYSHPLTYEYHPTLETICERSR